MSVIKVGDKVKHTEHTTLNKGLMFEIVSIENGIATVDIDGENQQFPIEELVLMQEGDGGFFDK